LLANGATTRNSGGRLHPQSVSKIVKARIAAQHERLGTPESKALEDAARYSGHRLRVGFAAEQAAKSVVEEAAKHLCELRVAEVAEQDLVFENGKVLA
jgi:hypothetical protein